jgi:hypothetical protein
LRTRARGSGRRLVCPICAGETFVERRSLLNTRGFTFFGLDWANRTAVNYICATCGYIMWFLSEPAR